MILLNSAIKITKATAKALGNAARKVQPKEIWRAVKKPCDPEKIESWIAYSKTFMRAQTRHIKEKLKEIKNIGKQDNISMKSIRKKSKDSYKYAALKVNETVTAFGNRLKKLEEGKKYNIHTLMNFYRSKYFKPTALTLGGAIAFSLLEKAGNSFVSDPAIPKHYKRGYDLMKETLTDFGSPVNLLKTASKVITPYYSSIRDNITTNTKTIMDRNIALFLNKNAIRHTRY